MNPALTISCAVLAVLLLGSMRIGRLARIRNDWLRGALLGPVVPVHFLLTLLITLCCSPRLLAERDYYSRAGHIYDRLLGGALVGR